MAGCHIIDVHDIHACLDIGRHAALHEIHDDLPCRGRFHIACADRGTRIDDDNRQSCLRKLDDLLFGQVLRPFVVAGHLFERDGRFFRAEPSARRKADRADGAAVDNPLDNDVAGCFQQILGAGDVDVIKDRGVFGPERIVRCDMVELSATSERSAQRDRIAQVAFDPLDGQILNILKVGASTGQDADVEAALNQRSHHCAADESGCAGDENFHLEDVKGKR